MTLEPRRLRRPAAAIYLLALPLALPLVAWSCPSVDGTSPRAESQASGDAPRRAALPADEVTGEPAECAIPYAGVVAIVPVRTQHALAKAVAARDSTKLVYATGDTAIYEDGRVLTTRLEDVGEHLTQLGWVGNPMRILGASSRGGSFAATRASSTGRSTKRRRG